MDLLGAAPGARGAGEPDVGGAIAVDRPHARGPDAGQLGGGDRLAAHDDDHSVEGHAPFHRQLGQQGDGGRVGGDVRAPMPFECGATPGQHGVR